MTQSLREAVECIAESSVEKHGTWKLPNVKFKEQNLTVADLDPAAECRKFAGRLIFADGDNRVAK